MNQVLRSHNARTAIVIGQGPQWVRLIRLSEGELTISRATDEDLDAEGFKPFSYPIEKAAAQFLKHNGGCSAAATRELLALAYSDLV